MGFGMIVNDNVKLNIGETREKLIEKLDNEEIRYKIVYDDMNNDNDKETVMSIGEYDLELHLFNDMLYSIRTYNNEYTHVLDYGEEVVSPSSFISTITAKVSRLADLDNESIKLKIEKLDLTSMKCIFMACIGERKYKVLLSKDAHGNVYINTIRDIY